MVSISNAEPAQGFARRLLRKLRSRADPAPGRLWSEALEAGHIWQRRFYDFVVFSEKKRVEKLRYMHRNPVKRGLAHLRAISKEGALLFGGGRFCLHEIPVRQIHHLDFRGDV
jgi:hypothetical protein